MYIRLAPSDEGVFKSAAHESVGMDTQTDAGIYARESAYLERFVQVGVASGRVLRVSFPERPEPEASEDHPLLDRLFTYLDGVEPVGFEDVTVALTLPTDRRGVLEAVRTLPYGESATVSGVAAMTAGLDAEAEADLALVRSALAENPAPILIPDHRVRDGPSAAPPAVEQRLRSLEGL